MRAFIARPRGRVKQLRAGMLGAVLKLAFETPAAWTARAVANLDEVLLDHAHCEKKAAGVALTHPDPRLEARLDAVLDRIIAHLVPPDRDKVWTEATWDRELYPAGHFIEAAIAHHQATGKRKALDAALIFADRLAEVYGPGRRPMIPNHEEIEIALVRLYRLTGQRKYLDLAKFFLDERGRPGRPSQGENAQDHKPVAEQTEAVGHCVMAMYLYSAMTDVAALTGDPAYRRALDRLWTDVVSGKTYLTGGLRAIRFHERFGAPFELPNVSAWAETCAAYGNALGEILHLLLLLRNRKNPYRHSNLEAKSRTRISLFSPVSFPL